MAGIKNSEVSAILREWIEKAGISQAEASRQLNVSPPVLWRQLEAKDSIPFSRIEQIVNFWAPSDEEITRLESLMNEVLAPSGCRDASGSNHGKYAGKLDLIAQMLRNAIAPSVPENMQVTVKTIADSIDEIASAISGKNRQSTDSGVKLFTLPRKSPLAWQKQAVQGKIKNLLNSLGYIRHVSTGIMIRGAVSSGLTESDLNDSDQKHLSWVKSNQERLDSIFSILDLLEEKADKLDQVSDSSKLEQDIRSIESEVSSVEQKASALLSDYNHFIYSPQKKTGLKKK